MIGFKYPAPKKARIEHDTFWPDCQLHVDPFNLPVRYELPGRTAFERAVGATWAVTLYKSHIVLWRDGPLRRAKPFVMPLEEFDAVAIAGGYARSGKFRIAVNLQSKKHELSIPLYVADHSDDAAAYWQAWGRSLGLPVRVSGPDGSLTDPLKRLGSVVVGQALPRRASRQAAQRRCNVVTVARTRVSATKTSRIR